SSRACCAPSCTTSRRSTADLVIPTSLVHQDHAVFRCVSRLLQRNPLLDTAHHVNIVVMRACQRSGISPEASAVISLMTSGRTGTSRRTVLRGMAAAGALAATGVFTGCGMPGTRRDPAECRAPDRSDSDRRPVVSNWRLYIDVSEESESLRPPPPAVKRAQRDLGDVPGGHQRQQRVLRQGA